MLLKAELESYSKSNDTTLLLAGGYQCSLKLNLNHTNYVTDVYGKNLVVSMLLKAELESYILTVQVIRGQPRCINAP